MENQQSKIEDSGSALSFSCYSSDSITSRAVAKAICEEEVSRFHENGDVNDEDFEFSLVLRDEESESQGWTLFKRDLLVNDHEISGALEDSSSSSSSSSEADELESPRSRNKYKKSSSIGSGSKRWIFRYLLRRSNSEGKESRVVLTPKKAGSPKQKRSSGEVMKVSGWLKAHEQFYGQKRAENEVEKRRSYLPYKKDVVGLFGNVNGMGKMLRF